MTRPEASGLCIPDADRTASGPAGVRRSVDSGPTLVHGPMPDLTSKQRAHLRKLAHSLKPVVLVGGDGISGAVLGSITDALNTRELLKVKLQESAPIEVRDAAAAIASGIEDVHPVQTIGKTIVLYRPHPDDPEIVLPRTS